MGYSPKPSLLMAWLAERRITAAKEQFVPGDATGISYEDKDGRWHDEASPGGDRPETVVEGLRESSGEGPRITDA